MAQSILTKQELDILVSTSLPFELPLLGASQARLQNLKQDKSFSLLDKTNLKSEDRITLIDRDSTFNLNIDNAPSFKKDKGIALAETKIDTNNPINQLDDMVEVSSERVTRISSFSLSSKIKTRSNK